MYKPIREMSKKEFSALVRDELAWLGQHEIETKHFLDSIAKQEKEAKNKPIVDKLNSMIKERAAIG